MRFVRFRDRAGYVRTGEWSDDEITSAGRSFDPDVVDVLPPVDPSKIICVGANYVDHVREAGFNVPEDLPDRPSVFLKGPNTVAGQNDTVMLPSPDASIEEPEDWGNIKIGEGRIDFEAELGVVIGEQCRNVSKDDAGEVIRGYTCVNDISNRDDQYSEQNWIRGKAFDNAAPIGPVVASPDRVPTEPRIQLRQNGERKQDSATDEMVFSVPEVIADVTKFLTLEQGDVIAMGTPAGVGPLQDGDEIEIEIEGIGTLVHYVEEPGGGGRMAEQ